MKKFFKIQDKNFNFKKYLLFFKDKNFYFILKNILTLTLALCLSWLIYDYGSLSLSKKTSTIQEDLPEEFELNYKDYDTTALDFKNELSSTVSLIRAVTGILKSYYVDNTKLNNTFLILYTLENLADTYHDIDILYSFNENSDFKKLDISSINSDLTSNTNSNSNTSLFLKKTSFLKITTPFTSLKLTLYPNLDDSTLNLYLLKTSFLMKYYFHKTQDTNINSSSIVLNALLENLDPHSNLLTKEDYDDLKMSTEGHFGGVGIIVNIKDYLLNVVELIPNTPAYNSGRIFPNDKIIKINDTFTFGVPLDELIESMRGTIGDKVTLSILSSKTNTIQTITLKRQDIEKSSVSTLKLEDTPYNIAYLKIDTFSKNTHLDLLSSLDSFKNKHGNIQGLVLDLRSNPGGLFDQAIKVSDTFLSSGTIVSTKGQWEEISTATTIKENVNKSLFSKKEKKDFYHTTYPMIVLVNQESASASEIVAGALQDNSRALIIGQPTFGKGSVQTLMQLNNKLNPALKLTVSRYFTPKGKSIQNTGIIPDVWLQPIYTKKTNSNILGTNRLNNENFSKNRLSSSSLSEYLNSVYIPPLKGYYLVNEEQINNLSSSVSLNQNEDYEIDISSRILNKVLSTYNGMSLKSMFRPYHWLGLAKEVNTYITTQSNVAKSWIKNQFGINWDTDSTNFHLNEDSDRSQNYNSKDINLTILAQELKSITGNHLSIPINIRNNSNNNLDKLSLFVLSSDSSIESNERIISGLKAHSQRKETINIYIPNYVNNKYIPIYLGLTQDSTLISSTVISNSIKVEPSNKSDINYKIVNKGIKNNKILFDINIENTGSTKINEIFTNLVNLSGNIINISKDTYTNKIPTNRSVTLAISINLKDNLTTNINEPIDIGLSISSDDIKSDIMKVLQISLEDKNKNTYSINIL